MRFSPGCCCDAGVTFTCPTLPVLSVPSRIYVTIIDEDGDCPDLDELSFALDHYPPYDGTTINGLSGATTRYWFPVGWDGSVAMPQLPCDTPTIRTQYVGIKCSATVGRYDVNVFGVIGNGVSTDEWGAAQLPALLSPLLVEYVQCVGVNVFECCTVFPANLRVIISETPP